MAVLTQAGLFGAIICLLAIIASLYKKSPLWKNFLFGLITCLLIFCVGLITSPYFESIKNPAVEKPTAPLIKYEIQSINAPSQREVDSWRKGLLCRLTYNIMVEKEQPTDEEFKTIAMDIIEKDAKSRSNWNAVFFYLHTPQSVKTAVAYMEAIYALNGQPEHSNKLRPGTYNSKYRLIVFRTN